MCKYVSKKNSEKMVFLDIHGGSATMQTRSKSRLTDGFNILKVNNDTLYILSIIIGEEEEVHKIYEIKASKEILANIDTSLSGYNEEKLYEIIGNEMPSAFSMAESLGIILQAFSFLPGRCDVVLKKVTEYSDRVTVNVIPLVTKKRDSKEDYYYYPYCGGNFRDIIEYAIRAGEITEYKKGNYSNIRKRKIR